MKIFSIALVALLVAACSNSKMVAQKNYDKAVSNQEVSLEKEWVTYSRGACFGTCPNFEITIYTDGSALYRGKGNVPQIGTFFGQLTKVQIEELKESIKTNDIWNTPENLIDERLMDAPTLQLRVVEKSKVHHIKHHGPGAENVKAVERLIDEIINNLDLRIKEK